MTTPALRPLSLGEVLDVSFGIYRSRFSALFLIAVCAQIVPSTMRFFLGSVADYAAHPVMAVCYIVFSLVLTNLGVAACTLVVSGSYLGIPISAQEALRRSLPVIGRLIVVSLMTALVVGFGTVLLIIPGLIALAGYILSSAVVVIEAPIGPSDAMSRSWRLTKGARFRILIATMIPFLLLMVPALALGIAAGIFQITPDDRMIEVLIAVLTVFFYPFLYVVIGVSYYDMRIRKEGFDLELLAAAVHPA